MGAPALPSDQYAGNVRCIAPREELPAPSGPMSSSGHSVLVWALLSRTAAESSRESCLQSKARSTQTICSGKGFLKE